MSLVKRPRLWPGLNCLACLCPPLPTGLQYIGNCCPVAGRRGPKGCQHSRENDIKHCISSTPLSFETRCPTLIHILGFHTGPQRAPKGSHLQLELRFAKHVGVQRHLQLCFVLFKHTHTHTEAERRCFTTSRRAICAIGEPLLGACRTYSFASVLARFENICLTVA